MPQPPNFGYAPTVRSPVCVDCRFWKDKVCLKFEIRVENFQHCDDWEKAAGFKPYMPPEDTRGAD